MKPELVHNTSTTRRAMDCITRGTSAVAKGTTLVGCEIIQAISVTAITILSTNTLGHLVDCPFLKAVNLNTKQGSTDSLDPVQQVLITGIAITTIFCADKLKNWLTLTNRASKAKAS
jgi:hypothetical protein